MLRTLLFSCCICCIICFSGCKTWYVTAHNCYEKFPPIIIDSSFVVDTVVRIDSVTVNNWFRLNDLTDRDQVVHDDSVYTLSASLDKNPLNSGVPLIHYEIKWKEKLVHIKAVNVDSMVKLISFYKISADTLTETNKKLITDLQKEQDRGFFEVLFTYEGLLIFLSGLGITAAAFLVRKFV